MKKWEHLIYVIVLAIAAGYFENHNRQADADRKEQWKYSADIDTRAQLPPTTLWSGSK